MESARAEFDANPYWGGIGRISDAEGCWNHLCERSKIFIIYYDAVEVTEDDEMERREATPEEQEAFWKELAAEIRQDRLRREEIHTKKDSINAARHSAWDALRNNPGFARGSTTDFWEYHCERTGEMPAEEQIAHWRGMEAAITAYNTT